MTNRLEAKTPGASIRGGRAASPCSPPEQPRPARSPRLPGSRMLLAAALAALAALPAAASTLVEGQEAQARAAVPSSASEESGAGLETLERWIARALASQPRLRAQSLEAEAAAAAGRAARRLPDLRLAYGEYLEEVETRVGPQRRRLELSAALPWPGTLDARARAARSEAAVALAGRDALERRLVRELRHVWAELYALERTRALTRENLELLRRTEEIARRRYAVAEARHGDLLRVQVEIGLIEEGLASLGAREAALLARARRLGARHPGEPAPAVDVLFPSELVRLGLEQRAAEEPVAEEAEALDARLVAHPLLEEARAAAARQRARSSAERLELRPDLGFGLAFVDTGPALNPATPESGKDPLIATFALSLPLSRDAIRARALEAELRAQAAEARGAAIHDELAAGVEDALARHADASRTIEAYRGTLIPRVQDSLRVSVIAYSTGEGDFLDLLDTERTLLDMQLALERARAERAIAFADLAALLGGGAAEEGR